MILYITENQQVGCLHGEILFTLAWPNFPTLPINKYKEECEHGSGMYRPSTKHTTLEIPFNSPGFCRVDRIETKKKYTIKKRWLFLTGIGWLNTFGFLKFFKFFMYFRAVHLDIKEVLHKINWIFDFYFQWFLEFLGT